MLRVAPFMVNFSCPPGLPPLSLRPFHHRAAGLSRRRDGPSGWSSYVNHWRCQLEYQGMRWDQDICHEKLWNPIGGANEILIWRYVKIMRIKVAWEMDEKNPPSEMMVKCGRKAIVCHVLLFYVLWRMVQRICLIRTHSWYSKAFGMTSNCEFSWSRFCFPNFSESCLFWWILQNSEVWFETHQIS